MAGAQWYHKLPELKVDQGLSVINGFLFKGEGHKKLGLIVQPVSGQLDPISKVKST